MKTYGLYIVGSALIAMSALLCWSYAFEMPVRHWGAAAIYVAAFTFISTSYQTLVSRVRTETRKKSTEEWHEWALAIPKSADAVDPNDGSRES